MENILIVILVLLLTQTIKFLLRLFSSEKGIDKNIIWVFLWATGIPSAHSAILTSGLVLVYQEYRLSSIFIFSLIVCIIIMYNLVADREREVIRKHEFFFKDRTIETRIIDISGHKFVDIITGIISGVVLTLILLELF